MAESKPLKIRLTIDAGLAAYIRAEAKILYGSDRAAIIALLRNAIQTDIRSDGWLLALYPHLPPEIQKAWAHRIAPLTSVNDHSA